MSGRDAEPVVSVVLPVRNGAATLARAIASVRAQTLRAWELVLVDDGSTDGTAEIAAAAARAGAFALPAGSRDAAVLAVLEPGAYTVQVSGPGAATGVALLEIYDVP